METKLKELRESKNLNQEDVSKIINKTRSTYCKYEMGILEPDLDTLIKIADFYKVSIDYIVGRYKN